MNSDIEQAINAEKTFNNKNNLLITFLNPELNENSFKKLHRSIQNVHTLEPEFIPKIRYIIELKDLSEADTIKHTILRSQYNKGYLTINFLDNFVASYKNIDPYKLQVKNLPVNITDREIKQLYPLCTQYHFIRPDSRNTKSILVHFTNVRDAISAYKITNKILFRSNQLKVQFYRDKTKSSEDSHEDHTDSEDDISKWEKIEKDYLENKKVSDTLLIKNFPIDTTGAEVLKLYPQCREYKFVFDNSNKTKNAIVKFSKEEDAIKMYTESNNIFKSNILNFEFYFYDKNKRKRKRAKLKQEKYKEDQQNSSNLSHFESKLNEEGINSKNIDSSVLHIQNLPISTTNENLLELFPDHQQYQIIPNDITNTSSAYICFNTPFEALQAFKSTKNKIYKRKMLSVTFKSKKLKINPFALKRKTSDIENTDYPLENNEKRLKINETQENDDVIVVEETSINPKIINEDEVECKSEDENYEDDIYAGVDLEIDELDHEDNISDDNDFQGIELDDDVLPLDEDDF